MRQTAAEFPSYVEDGTCRLVFYQKRLKGKKNEVYGWRREGTAQ